ncbi:MAG: biopolymer transporter ExbD [Candidatus Omnitrophica bacterium]|nr:biopolymer transporter ExbD [Candidatus Omnitrophota bacterium]
MRFRRSVFIEKGILDMAPLMNIIFLLLIFFMLTSSFVFQPGIRVDLPKAVTSEVLNQDLMVIVITHNGDIYISERLVTKEETVSHLALASKSNKQVLIKADKTAGLGKVVEIWDICRESGVKQINIATTQK